jgi:PKD repeat protein
MHRILSAVLLLAAVSAHAQSSCPTNAPYGQFRLSIGCQSPCIAGSNVPLTVYSIAECPPSQPGVQPPPSCTQYQIQACDRLTWDFGDGTTATVIGQTTIEHTYAAPGAYQPSMTISNALGSVQMFFLQTITIAANPPAYVEFSQTQVTVPETARSIAFTLIRSGNLSISSTVHWAHAETLIGPVNQADATGGDITFALGETTKSFSLRIYDDHMYTGPQVGDIVSVTATDGTIPRINGVPAANAVAYYTLTEVDPQPTVSVADVRVREDVGGAFFVVRLSAPIGVSVVIYGTPADGTAKSGSDYSGSAGCSFAPGNTQCVIPIAIVNDAVREPDETFTLTIDTLGGGVAPSFARNTATCTIVDDDAGTLVVEPAAVTLRPSDDATINVSLQPPRGTAEAASVTSTRRDVVTAPDSLIIPPGGTAAIPIRAVAAGTATISISTGDGVVYSVDVTVLDAPLVTRIEPPRAPVTGGAAVALIGDRLDARCSVSFGSASGLNVAQTGLGLSVVVPEHDPGTVDVNVVCGSARITLPNAFTFFVPRRRAAG